ncbi:helix-turn-helix domain-containing protein [Paenibacillus camelliae]|uniref:helix-turn-helix domain-containing protein n=1 Tax=Paenibacillus camelliae TaxID=512410 RepID=UPI00203B2C57|nr:helix-turn-helix transcriptional regulator [Paenibacillus camelliae]MCM3632905.1 helix-turn-helix domain-containing protein [Paenibacillus camelliae]
MRKRYTEVEEKLMKDISNNLKKILKEKGIIQRELAEKSGLSTSAISDYVNGNNLVSPGKLQMIADALNVSKGDIDPTYKSDFVVQEGGVSYGIEVKTKFNPFEIFELVDKYTDDEIIEKYHHQDDGGTLTEQQIRMHLQHVRFLKTQK